MIIKPHLHLRSDSTVDVEGAREFAEKYGLPVMLKAVHGGGGRGMRVVRDMKEMEDSFQVLISFEGTWTCPCSTLFVLHLISLLQAPALTLLTPLSSLTPYPLTRHPPLGVCERSRAGVWQWLNVHRKVPRQT